MGVPPVSQVSHEFQSPGTELTHVFDHQSQRLAKCTSSRSKTKNDCLQNILYV